MIKTCVTCGKTFIGHHRQLNCSHECTVKYNTEQRKIYSRLQSTKERSIYMRRIRDNPIICEFCGKAVPRQYEIRKKPRAHEHCIVNACRQYLIEGQRVPNSLYQRFYALGYTIEELREEIENETKR
ncbi:MAG: hypothetical protein MJ068_04750 [Clostridia bacterium]|nr:hypothetical protein [Clostridia bacterium]